MMNTDRRLTPASAAPVGHRRRANFVGRILALAMILVLLCVRLGNYSEEKLIIPVEDALFGVAFISDGANPLSKPHVIKSKALLDADMPPFRITVRIAPPIIEAVPDDVSVSYPDEWTGEIFIPPEQPA